MSRAWAGLVVIGTFHVNNFNVKYIFRMDQIIMLITLAAMVLYVYNMVRNAFMETGRPCEHDGKYKSIHPSSLCHQIFNAKKNVLCACTQYFSAILFGHKVTIPLYHKLFYRKERSWACYFNEPLHFR